MADYDWFSKSPKQLRIEQEKARRLAEEGFEEDRSFGQLKCLKCHSLIYISDKEKHKEWHKKLGA